MRGDLFHTGRGLYGFNDHNPQIHSSPLSRFGDLSSHYRHEDYQQQHQLNVFEYMDSGSSGLDGGKSNWLGANGESAAYSAYGGTQNQYVGNRDGIEELLLITDWGDTTSSGGGGNKMSSHPTSYAFFPDVINSSNINTVFMVCMMVWVVVWSGVVNLTVILAVYREKRLHSIINYFITSLAVADLLVSLAIMPFAIALYITDGDWVSLGLGGGGAGVFCTLWTSCDILCCTASILLLTAIALDRHWAVSQPVEYHDKMTDRRCSVIIAFVWIFSTFLALAQVLWRAIIETAKDRRNCTYTIDREFRIVSSMSSFFVPLTVLIFTYVNIIQIAISSSSSSSSTSLSTSSQPSPPKTEPLLTADSSTIAKTQRKQHQQVNKHPKQHTPEHQKASSGASIDQRSSNVCEGIQLLDCDAPPQRKSQGHQQQESPCPSPSSLTMSMQNLFTDEYRRVSTASSTADGSGGYCLPELIHSNAGYEPTEFMTTHDAVNESGTQLQKSISPSSVSSLKTEELHTAKLIGLVIICFVFCWLPFFSLYILEAFCITCQIPSEVSLTFLWLGYAKSGVNPIIYFFFDRSHRIAYLSLYKSMLSCCKRPSNYVITLQIDSQSALWNTFSKIPKHKSTNSFYSKTTIINNFVSLSDQNLRNSNNSNTKKAEISSAPAQISERSKNVFNFDQKVIDQFNNQSRKSGRNVSIGNGSAFTAVMTPSTYHERRSRSISGGHFSPIQSEHDNEQSLGLTTTTTNNRWSPEDGSQCTSQSVFNSPFLGRHLGNNNDFQGIDGHHRFYQHHSQEFRNATLITVTAPPQRKLQNRPPDFRLYNTQCNNGRESDV